MRGHATVSPAIAQACRPARTDHAALRLRCRLPAHGPRTLKPIAVSNLCVFRTPLTSYDLLEYCSKLGPQGSCVLFFYTLERDDATSDELVAARVPRGHRQVDGCAHGFAPALSEALAKRPRAGAGRQGPQTGRHHLL